jgi:outer membrane protein assembly factor BamB
MKRLLAVTLICVAHAQVSSNWTTFAGDPQRSGWERLDTAISKDTVKDLQLLWKMKLENQPKGSRPIMPPLIVGRLISYRGFKELAIVGTGSDIVYAIDADLGKMFWQKHLEYSTAEPQATGSCALTAMPAMPAPLAGRGGPGGASPAGAGRGGSAFIGGGGPASIYAISSDGRLHRLNVSTGDDIVQPVSVLPANAGAGSLNMVDNVIYTVTSYCGGLSPAVWAIDLNVDPPKVTSFPVLEVEGLAGPVIATDGTVYVQDGLSGTNPGLWELQALSPRELKVKQRFGSTIRTPRDASTPSPIVFPYKGRDLIVAGDGSSLYLLDSASLGGADSRTPLYRTPPIATAEGLASWEDPDGVRWVLAPVWGPNGSAPNGSIAAFKVEEQGGKTVLTPAWVSRDMNFPQAPVIANGVVFALSSGEFNRQMSPKNGTHATLYALDAATGKELYSSRNLMTAPAALTGMTVANGRVYFGTTDGTFYTFGMYMEH